MLFNYIIHLPNKIFFPIQNKNEEIHKIFKKLGFIHNIEVPENKKFAVETYEKLKELNFDEIINTQIKKNPRAYSTDIIQYLDEETQKKLILFFNNDKEIDKVSSMLGYKVKFRKLSIFMNFQNDKTKIKEGPKMFHRDSDSLQDQVKIFMLINNIDEKNGMFYFVPKNLINENYKLPFESDLKNKSLADKWRNHDETVFSLAKKNNFKNPVRKLSGSQGELLYIDTGKIYHKGGYILEKGKLRFMFQVVYTPTLSLSNWNNSNNFLLRYLQNKLKSLQIKLQKTINL